MEKTQKPVNARQIAVVLFIVLITFKLALAPTVFMRHAGHDAWFSFGLAFLINLVMFFVVLGILKKIRGQNFYAALKVKFGTVIAKVFVFILLLFFLFKIARTDYATSKLLANTLYERINWAILIIPVFLTVCYVAGRGPQGIARCTEIFYWFALVVLFIVALFSLQNIQIGNLLPVLETGFKPVLRGMFWGLTDMGEFLFLLIFSQNLKKKKNSKGLIFAALSAGVILVFFTLLFVSIFGPVGQTLHEGILRIAQYQTGTRSLLRLDGIIVVLWVPLTLLTSAIHFYAAGWCLAHLFPIKKFPIAVFICGILGYILQLGFLTFLHKGYIYVSLFCQIGIPLILILAFLKNKSKGEGV